MTEVKVIIKKHLRLSVVCPSCIGCRSVWLKVTPNGSGLLPSPQPLPGIAKVLEWQSTPNQQFLKLENKLKNTLEILLSVYIEHVKFQEASFNSN